MPDEPPTDHIPDDTPVTLGVDLGQGNVFIAALDAAGRVTGPYTAVGHTSTDGITTAAPGITAERVMSWLAAYGFGPAAGEPQPAQPVTPAGGDVLDTIDATLTGLCACGCREPLAPDGPSAYFADDACQWRWNNRRATDPGDVYRRADQPPTAAPRPNPATPPAPPPLPPGWQPLLDAPLGAAGVGGLSVAVWECPNILGAGYRVPCPGCAARVIPSVTRIADRSERPFHLANPPRLQVFHRCPRCWVQLPGPPLIADVKVVAPPVLLGEQPTTSLVLSLSDGGNRIERTLDLPGLRQATNPGGIIDGVWTDMATALGRRRAEQQRHAMAVQLRMRHVAVPVINHSGHLHFGGA